MFHLFLLASLDLTKIVGVSANGRVGGFLEHCGVIGFQSSNDEFNQLFIDVKCNGDCSMMNIGSCVANIGGNLTPWPK